MKIYNISRFEKLKIRPVDVNSMHVAVEMVDARSIGFSDLKFGYIVETDETDQDDNPFYMLVDVKTFMKIMDYEDFSFDPKMVLLQPDSEEHDDTAYLCSEAYRRYWPCYNGPSKFDIKHVYIINCDPSKVETKDEFIELYYKYMQYIDRP